MCPEKTHKVGSKAFSLNRQDAVKIAKAFGLQVVAMACVFAVSVLQGAELPQYVALLVPTISTALYALQRWATDRSQNLYKVEE